MPTQVNVSGLERALKPFLQRKAAEILSRSQQNVPHLSGLLASSLHIENTSPLSFKVGSNIPYTNFIELRTHFLSSALSVIR